MKTLRLIQGSPEWHAHRAQHHNASEASIMLGKHPSITRSELLKVRATGIESEVSDFLQRIFDEGHRFEALARPLAEDIVGEELYPCVGVEGAHSASFDGLTLMEDTAFEHKMLNADLREAMFEGCTGTDLPVYHRIQMEHQCMVSGAERVLFMASEWDGDTLIEERHCWYTPDPDLRAQIVAGWVQFEADVAAYEVPIDAPAVVGRAPESLPALRIEVAGMVTASNLEQFRDHAIAIFRGIRTDLSTDQDFADADKTVKWCGEIESKLKAAKEHALSQTESIDRLFRAIDDISAEARAKRLELEKLVAQRKEAIRTDLVAKGWSAVASHYDALNDALGEYAIAMPASVRAELGAAIKGKRTIATLQDAVATSVADFKIEATQRADRVRACVALLGELTSGYESLFPDRVALCLAKTPEDLRNLVTARVAEHQLRERDRQERGRAQREEAERIERERAQQTPVAGAPAAQQPLDDAADNAGVATGSRNAPPCESVTRGNLPPVISSGARIKLGDINEWIAPLSVTAVGLEQLGIKPVSTDRAAKLFAAEDFPRICEALARVIATAPSRAAAKAAA